MIRIKDYVDNKGLLFQSYSSHWINDDVVSNMTEANATIQEIVRLIQTFDSNNPNLKEFFEIINKDDLLGIGLFFDDITLEIKRNEKK